MSNTRRNKKHADKSWLYTVIIIVLAVLILALVILIPKIKELSAQPTPTPETTATAQPVPTVQNSSDISYTVNPSQSITEQPTPEVSPSVGPTVDVSRPLVVPDDKIFVLHITVDGGIMNEDTMLFDEDYLIETDETDYTDIKLMIFVTDYNGNSGIYRFDNVNAMLAFESFWLTGESEPREIAAASELSASVDAAHNVKIKWAGKNLYATGENAGGNVLTYTDGGKAMVLTVDILDLQDKSDYQR